ncbi:MAG TPA: sphingomyelin phosphodiesterase [Ohtaekwangia sp.]|uniref:sphingomyelin phosphodiesterase n=1 Tax=Ohtaekwangia sp. TaxID=2066019 RepID=UPI002F925F08
MKYGLLGIIILLTFQIGNCQSINSDTLSAKSIKILSWNIYMLPAIVKIKGRSDRAAAIGDILSKSNYDIIVFQEAFHLRARRKIYRQLVKAYPYQAGPANKKLLSCRTNSGLWIFSKHPIVHSYDMIFANRSGIDAFSRKGGLLAEIMIHNQPVQIAGTHLQSSGGDWIRHSQCVEFYHKLLKEYSRPGVPQVICGDFNINRKDEEVYNQMLKILGAADGALSGESVYSYDPLQNDLNKDKNTLPHLIDYILLRNNDSHIITCLKRNIRIFRQGWSKKHTDLSDHYSVEAELQIYNEKLASTASR